MNSGKVLLGVLAGVVAGGLLGVLFAPDKGSKTRKKISKAGLDQKDAIKENFNKFLDKFAKKFEKVKEEVAGFVDHDKSKLKEAQSDGKSVKV